MSLNKEEKKKFEVENDIQIFNTGILAKLFLPSLIIAME